MEEYKSGTDLLTRDTIESLKKSLHLTIKTKDVDNNEQSYDCKIELVNKFSNDKLSYTQFVKDNEIDVNYLPFQNLSLFSYNKNFDNTETVFYSMPTKANTLEDLGYIYDELNDVYTKVDYDGGFIKYTPEMDTINYILNEGNVLKIDFNKPLNKFLISITDENNRLIYEVRFNFVNNNINCLYGNCNKYLDKITYIMGIYNEINSTLQ